MVWVTVIGALEPVTVRPYTSTPSVGLVIVHLLAVLLFVTYVMVAKEAPAVGIFSIVKIPSLS